MNLHSRQTAVSAFLGRTAHQSASWFRRFATADFCPWADRYVARAITPLGVLIIASIAALLCGGFVAPQGFIAFVAIALVIAIGLIWPAAGMRGLSCDLQFGELRGQEGVATAITVSIRNRWPWPVWGLAIEEGFGGCDGEGDSMAVALARIGGWSRSEFEWEFIPPSRGLYPSTPPRLVTGFPFGLWKARRALVVNEQIVVWPATFALPALELPSGRQSWRGNPSDARVGHEGERIGARPYRHGDAPRSIHWALTARHDRLIVCERQRAAQTQVCVDVDVASSSHGGAGTQSTRERALRIAASVCQTLLAQDSSVHCRLGQAELTAYPGRRDYARLMDWFATFDAEFATRPIDAPHQAAARRSATAYQIFIGTDRSQGGPESQRSSRVMPIILATQPLDSSNRRAGVEEPTPQVVIDRKIWIDVHAEIAGQVSCGWRQKAREI